MNVAATWQTRLFKSRGLAMGQEHKGKGVDVQLGPVAGPIGRVPAGGRNWEGILVTYFFLAFYANSFLKASALIQS